MARESFPEASVAEVRGLQSQQEIFEGPSAGGAVAREVGRTSTSRGGQ